MKNSLLLLFLVLYCISLQAQITSFPYSEDFEETDGGWSAAGESSSWQWGQPANTFISAAASGTNAWLTNKGGNYNNNELSYLLSPRFNFTGLSKDPVFRFQYIHELEENFDGAWLEASTDGGSSWTKLGNTVEEFIYNNQAAQRWDGRSGINPNSWEQASILLSGFAGKEEVRFRFVLQSDGVYPLEGIGIDKVEVLASFSDAAVVETSLKEINCSLSAAEIISVKVKNQGNAVIAAGKICLEIDGALYCETISQNIELLSTVSYTFEQPFDLSPAHTYDIKTFIEYTADANHENDTIRQMVVSAPVVSTFSYYEGFDESSGVWGAYGANSSWKIKEISATNAYWTTSNEGGYNNSEQSFLESPCMDFSAISVPPVLSFDLQLQTEETFDGLWMEFSTDGGINWQKIIASGSAISWYNNTEKQWWEGAFTQEGEWKKVSSELPQLVEQSNVKLRFAFSSDENFNRKGLTIDNILVTAPPYPSFKNNLFVCSALDTVLDAGNPGAEFIWSTGATTQTIPYSMAAVGMDTLWVDVKNKFGALRDTLLVSVSDLKIEQLNDTVVCEDSYIKLDPNPRFKGLAEDQLFYHWAVNGEDADNPKGVYQHHATGLSTDTVLFMAENIVAGCFVSDTILVNLIEKPAIKIVANEQISVQDTFRVYGVGNTGDYSWQVEGISHKSFTGKGPHYLSFSEPGRYSIELSATIGGCVFNIQDSVIISAVTGFEPEKEEWPVSVYPNPSNGSVTVKYKTSVPQQVSYQLFNLSGQQVWSVKFMEGTEVERRVDITKNLPAGMYTLLVSGRNFNERKLLAIE